MRSIDRWLAGGDHNPIVLSHANTFPTTNSPNYPQPPPRVPHHTPTPITRPSPTTRPRPHRTRPGLCHGVQRTPRLPFAPSGWRCRPARTPHLKPRIADATHPRLTLKAHAPRSQQREPEQRPHQESPAEVRRPRAPATQPERTTRPAGDPPGAQSTPGCPRPARQRPLRTTAAPEPPQRHQQQPQEPPEPAPPAAGQTAAETTHRQNSAPARVSARSATQQPAPPRQSPCCTHPPAPATPPAFADEEHAPRTPKRSDPQAAHKEQPPKPKPHPQQWPPPTTETPP